MTGLPPVAALEEVLKAALSSGDARGVTAALELIAVQDPDRASELHEAIQLGIAIGSAS
jgi:hypothetical protein